MPLTCSRFDPVRFGRCLRAARVLAGYDDVRSLARGLHRWGFNADVGEIAELVASIEEGHEVPPLHMHYGFVALLHPPRGFGFFDPAYDQELVAHRKRAQMDESGR